MVNDPPRRRSFGEHGQCGPAVSRLQPEEQRAGFLDVLLGTALGGRREGKRRRMIRSADERQSLGQASHGRTVDFCLIHSEVPKHQPVSSRRSVSGAMARAEQLNAPDTVCLAIAGAAGKKTPGTSWPRNRGELLGIDHLRQGILAIAHRFFTGGGRGPRSGLHECIMWCGRRRVDIG